MVDGDGKVVVINPVEPEKMPALTVPIKYGTGEKDRPPPKVSPAAAQAAALADPRGKNSPPKAPTIFGAEAAGGAKLFLESYDSQPPLIQTLRPEDGVDLTFGNQRRAGREIAGAEGRMSRAEYQEKTGFAMAGDRTASSQGADTKATLPTKRGRKVPEPAENRFPVLDPLKGGRPRAGGGPTNGGVHSRAGGGGAVHGGAPGPATKHGGGGDGVEAANDSGGSGAVPLDLEAAAMAAELELIAALNRNDGGNGGPIDPAPVQRHRDRVLHKNQRDVRNADLYGPMPTAYRSHLAPPGAAGMSTGHGSPTLQPLAASPAEAAASNAQRDSGEVVLQPGPVRKGAKVLVPEASESQGLRHHIALKEADRQVARF
jgi:hypothetical protein